MSLADTVRILGQVGRGLARAHELGIVHRDIKPDNVFLAHTADDGVIAKVFDFGIVKVADTINVADDKTQEGALLGTPQYMSPEQVEGASIDLRSDVYALGVMAYRLLTGRRLFPSDSLSTTLMRICNGPLPKLTEALTSLPPAMEDWFQRTCARDREQRFASAIECVDALAAAAGVAATGEMTVDPPPVARASGSVPPLESFPPGAPLETPTGLSAVQRTTPPSRDTASNIEPAAATTPEMRRKIAVIGGTAATLGFLALLAFLLSSRESRTGASAEPAATAAIPAASPTPPAPPPPAPTPAPLPAPVASARPATALPDAPIRTPPHPPPPRRPAGRARGDAPQNPPPDDRIHDVGY
jgi:serine/threonine protein kinase